MSKYLYEGKKIDADTIKLILSLIAGYGTFNVARKIFGPFAKNAGFFTKAGVFIFTTTFGISTAGMTHATLGGIISAINKVIEESKEENEDGGSEA